MTTEPQMIAFEQAVNALIEHRIVEVQYYEIKGEFDDLAPRWRSQHPRFHHLDFGLELSLETGKVLSFIWGNEFSVSYSLQAVQGSLLAELKDPAVWNVTQDALWTPVINRTIRNVNVYWICHKEPPAPCLRFPLDLEIDFDGDRRIFIGAYVLISDDVLFPTGDAIVVFFDSEVARHYQIGPYKNIGS